MRPVAEGRQPLPGQFQGFRVTVQTAELHGRGRRKHGGSVAAQAQSAIQIPPAGARGQSLQHLGRQHRHVPGRILL